MGSKLRSAEVLGGEEGPYRDPPESDPPALNALVFPFPSISDACQAGYVLVARITIETGNVESVCIICRMDVIARVDRRFESSTILPLSIFSFMLTGCGG